MFVLYVMLLASRLLRSCNIVLKALGSSQSSSNKNFEYSVSEWEISDFNFQKVQYFYYAYGGNLNYYLNFAILELFCVLSLLELSETTQCIFICLL